MSRLCLRHADPLKRASASPAVCSVCRLLRVRAELTEERDQLRYVLLHAEMPHAPACAAGDNFGCSCGYQLAMEGSR